MAQIVNVEYFYLKCNQILGTNYNVSNWGGSDNIKKVINIEWLCLATNRVYKELHKPKNGCTLLLSHKLKDLIDKIAVDKVLIDDVVSYLSNLNRLCDNDCACYRDLNCNCVCTNACASQCNNGTCSNATCKTCLLNTCSNSPPSVCTTCPNCGSGGTCNCVCTCSNCACQCNCNCACECGSNTECVCDCDYYECNCNQVLNCNIGAARPMAQNCTYNCGNCNCNCECETCKTCSTCGTCSITNQGSSSSSGACSSTTTQTYSTTSFGNWSIVTKNETPSTTTTTDSSVTYAGVVTSMVKTSDGGSSGSGGSSSSSGGCLPLWETLDTPKGNIKLSDLNIGDEIYSWNLFNNKIEIDKVIHKFISEHKNTIYKIEFEDGGYLYCDGAHTHYTTSWLRVIDPTNIEPFMINIFRVKKLKIGNKILSKDGYKVIKLITKHSEEQFGEIFSEKNLGYVIRGLYSAMPNKDLVKSIPEDFKMYGINEKKTKSIFKSSIVPMIVYLFRILFKKY